MIGCCIHLSPEDLQAKDATVAHSIFKNNLYRPSKWSFVIIKLCFANSFGRISFPTYTDMAKKSKDGLRDIARVRPEEIATREIRGSA